MGGGGEEGGVTSCRRCSQRLLPLVIVVVCTVTRKSPRPCPTNQFRQQFSPSLLREKVLAERNAGGERRHANRPSAHDFDCTPAVGPYIHDTPSTSH